MGGLKSDRGSRTEAIRVLVVDDNRDIVETMIAVLSLQGHQSRASYNGLDAIRCLREFEPEVVLLDIDLPGKNGWEVAASDQALAASKGFDYYLAKPADPKVVLALIEQSALRE